VKLHAQPSELCAFHRKVHPLVGDMRSYAFEHAQKAAQLVRRGGCNRTRTALDKTSLRDSQVARRAIDGAPAAVDPGHRIVE
jgi:hypothetical protein